MNRFVIRSLKIYKGKELHKLSEVDFEFSDNDEIISDFPFTTLVIGPNATGKSRILRLLVDIFNDLHNFNKDDRSPFFKVDYKLIYKVDTNVFEVLNTSNGLFATKNGVEMKIEELILPQKVIALASSISDRFPQQKVKFTNYPNQLTKNYNFDFYEYLGVRTFNNMASTTGHISRMLDMFVNAVTNNKVSYSLIEVFQFLNLRPKIKVEYRKKASYNNILGQKEVTEASLKEYISKLDEKKVGFAYRHFLSLVDDPNLLNEVVEFMNRLSTSGYSNKFPMDFDLDFSDIESLGTFSITYKMYNYLRKLNLITYGSITIEKVNGTVYDLSKGSSGEIHLMTSLISLGCIIEDSSLVLIDEPEISLHPNWQMKYLDLINSIFHSRYRNCHFIICTHSHFLVSDLRPESSFILTLKTDKDFNIIAKSIPRSTFGWSAEQILLDVFNVPTTRNFFVADRIGELLDLVSKSKRDVPLIKEKVRALIEQNILQLDEADPLKGVIDKLINKYGQE